MNPNLNIDDQIAQTFRSSNKGFLTDVAAKLLAISYTTSSLSDG